MDLHGQIMNFTIPIGTGFAPGTSGDDGYRMGHRDARHAAAELALKAVGSDACAEIERLRHSLNNAVKLADDRLAQMADDRAQALKWRDEAQRLRDICVNIHDGLLHGDDDKELMALAAQGWWKA